MMVSLSQAELVEPLLAALGEEVAALNLRRAQLGLLREAILRREDEAVGRLLEQLEQSQLFSTQLETRLSALRQAVAISVGLDRSKATLGQLIQRLDGPQAQALDQRRREIISLIKALQRQHLELAMLLRECARINRLMLQQLLGGGKEVTTYGSLGRQDWRDGHGLMDTES